MPSHVVRRHKTGSLADDFNDGRVGQFRSIENARAAYADQINKERRAQMRWRQEQELRIQCEADEQELSPDSSTMSHSHNRQHQHQQQQQKPLPLVVRDIFGNVSTVIPRQNYGLISSSSSRNSDYNEAINSREASHYGQSTGTPTKSRPSSATLSSSKCGSAFLARSSLFIAMPKKNYLPPNIPVTTSEIAAAGGNGTALRNGGWNFNYHRPSAATGTSNFAPHQSNTTTTTRRSSSSSSSQNNNNINNSRSTYYHQSGLRSTDSDDDDAISYASTTLSRKEERDMLKSKLDLLQQEVATSAKQREKLDNQIDELRDLIVRFKSEQREKRRSAGTFGHLDERGTEITYRAQRAPGIKSGLSGFAANRKQSLK